MLSGTKSILSNTRSKSTFSTDSSSSYESNDESIHNSKSSLLSSTEIPVEKMQGSQFSSLVFSIIDPRKVRIERMLLKRAESMTNMNSGPPPLIRRRTMSSRSLVSVLRDSHIQVPKMYDASTVHY